MFSVGGRASGTGYGISLSLYISLYIYVYVLYIYIRDSRTNEEANDNWVQVGPRVDKPVLGGSGRLRKQRTWQLRHQFQFRVRASDQVGTVHLPKSKDYS